MHKGNTSTSPVAADRRLTTLARHLQSSPMDSANQSIDVSPTSGAPNSVFHHVVQAPEDPILGVILA